MKRVEITSLWTADILRFVDHHTAFLADRFYDTGIDSEDSIRERYKTEWYEFGMGIYDHVIESLSREIVPYQEIDFGIRLSVFIYRKRRIFVRYFEKDFAREVFDIKIYHH